MSGELQGGERGEGWWRRVRCARLRDDRQRTPVRRSDRSPGQDARSACSGSSGDGGYVLVRTRRSPRWRGPSAENMRPIGATCPHVQTNRGTQPTVARSVRRDPPTSFAVTHCHDSWLRCVLPPSPRRSLSWTLEGTWSPAPEHASCAMPIPAWGAGRPATRCVEPDPVARPPREGGR